jgi:hypothetical protein
MLREPTMEKLYALRLAVMAAAWETQEKDPKIRAMDFGERFGRLVEAEHRARDQRRLARLLKQADLRIPEACIEDLKAGPARGLPVATVRQLATVAAQAHRRRRAQPDRWTSKRVHGDCQVGDAHRLAGAATAT